MSSFDDPAVLAVTAAAFRRARDRRLGDSSRSASPGVERDAGEPPAPLGLPGHLSTNTTG